MGKKASVEFKGDLRRHARTEKKKARHGNSKVTEAATFDMVFLSLSQRKGLFLPPTERELLNPVANALAIPLTTVCALQLLQLLLLHNKQKIGSSS